MFKIILTILIIYLDKCVVLTRSRVECGYKQCPATRDGALNVHLIAHSHMDAGWVKTFDEYYYGSKTVISTANVQLIYHSVLSELLHDKRRKFTFAETSYFWRWWKEQRPATRATFRTLVQEGRIEFAGGGWVQNDEATLDYMQIIDHYTWGLRKLNDTLGPCGKPKAAWQIDTYGHTREQASLLAQMGFDGLFLGRVDHREREAMLEEDRMEFMWRGSDVLGKMSDIMTHTLYNLYNAPEGFCFDFLCSDEPIVDDPDNRVYNADMRVNDFVQLIERQAKYYDHDNIMVTMGGDFTYQGAANWFMNMDKLLNHVNTHPGNITDVNIFYSTPSCYLKAIYLYGRRDKALYTEHGDHLPYGSDANTYWTGFYASRPSLKYLVKRAYVFLQVVKQLTVVGHMGDSYELHLLRHAVNLVIHHDAITGTSQQHVTNDFIRILTEAIEACSKKVSAVLSNLTPNWGGSRRGKHHQQFVVCHQLNMSQCRFAETQDSIILLVYNPLSTKTYHHVRIPAIALQYAIRDYNDEEVESQLVPLPASIINLPGRSSTAIQELCFEAENIPPLGFSAYYITPVRDQLEENDFGKKVTHRNDNVEPDQELVPHISNEYLKVSVNKDTGLLESIQHMDGMKVDVNQNFYFYSQNQQILQSGAYSFRPETSRPTPVTEAKVAYNVVRGILVKEIRQRFTDWVTQIIRLYRGEEFVELEWLVGPVPIGTDLGKEVVSLFKTNVSNSGQFYTDSNGRQMMERTCWNETATQQQKKQLASCFYPVTSRLCIQSHNSSVSMCVLTDRAQGGTSYNEGEIEMMVHRRLLTDDGFGLEESLNEEAFGVGLVVKGKHRIIISSLKQDGQDDLTANERVALAARRWQMEPWLFMTAGDKLSRRKWQTVRPKRHSALKLHGLPRHIHIVTLEPWKGGGVLLRLENTLEKPDRGPFRNSKTEGVEDYTTKISHITVQLRQLFLDLKIRMVRETTLAGNQWLDDARQMDWSTRYVYSGADDDILPEDILDHREEYKPPKEQVSYNSEEDYTRRKVQAPRKHSAQRRRTSSKYTNRYKRSVVSDKNINENIINATFNDLDTPVNIPILVANVTTNTSESSTHRVVNLLEDETTTLFNTMTSKATPVPTILRKSNLAKGFSGPVRIDDIVSSDRNYTYKRRGYSPRFKSKKASAHSALKFDEIDDGVTKSIFEMYYMTKPKYQGFRSDVIHTIQSARPTQRRRPNPPRRNFRNYSKKDKSKGRKNDNECTNRYNRPHIHDYTSLTRNSETESLLSHKEKDKLMRNLEDSSTRETETERYLIRNYTIAGLDNNTKYSVFVPNTRKYKTNFVKDQENNEDDFVKIIASAEKNETDSIEEIERRRKIFQDSIRENKGVIPNSSLKRKKGKTGQSTETFMSKNVDTPLGIPFFVSPFDKYGLKNTEYNSGEVKKHNVENKKSEKDSTTSKRAAKLLIFNSQDSSQEYNSDEDDDDDEYDDYSRQRAERVLIGEGYRKKRTADEPGRPTLEQAEPTEAEPDYIITLRPTQIRTFVIWFEPHRNPYNM